MIDAAAMSKMVIVPALDAAAVFPTGCPYSKL
jgi:hypothetical protein